MPIVVVLFLTVVNLLNYFDRYIVQAVEPSITAEFSLSNAQAGYVVSAFVLGYFVFSPLFGFLGDRFDRRRVMAAGLVAWSAATALTSFASGVTTFVLSRILVGVGEACYGAIVPAYLKGRIPDTIVFNRALSIFYVAIPVGSALGYVAGGQIAAVYGWRNLFLMAAAPGVVLALGFLMLRAEGMQRTPGQDGGTGGVTVGMRRILGSPVLVLVILGYVLNTFALSAVAAFVVRHGTTLGLSASEAATYFGIILVGTGLCGTLGGGMLASRIARQRTDSIKSFMAFVTYSTLLAVPFLALCFAAQSSWLFLCSCAVAELLIFAGVAPLNSIIVSRAPVGFEAFTQGVTIFAIQLFGGFLGPVIIGWVADVHGVLAVALQGSTLALLLSGVIWWCAQRLLARMLHETA
jgi:MFS family permease